jgi:hypothetical protein
MVSCVLLATTLAAAQDANMDKRLDADEAKAWINHVREITKGLTKAKVEAAQSQLDMQAEEFARWLTGADQRGQGKRLQAVWNAISSAQTQIDRVRGTPRTLPEFVPFAGNWRADVTGADRAVRTIVELQVDKFGRLRGQMRQSCRIWQYNMHFALQHGQLGTCITSLVEEDGDELFSVAMQQLAVVPGERKLKAEFCEFTLSENGEQLSALLRIRMRDAKGSREYDIPCELQRVGE